MSTSTSSTSTSTAAATPPSVVIGGMTIRLGTSVDRTVQTSRISKADRCSLSPKDLKEFEESATAKQHAKFLPLDSSPGLSDSDGQSLESTLTLHQTIAAMRESHRFSDIDDVFTIVFPDSVDTTGLPSPSLRCNSSGDPITANLYSDYINVTARDVAASCMWYNSYPDPAASPWLKANLRLTDEYMRNHTAKDLHLKVQESYSAFLPGQQGGPLYFKLLIDHLLVHTESMAESIIASIRSFKIHAQKGENVSKAVSLLRANCSSLHNIKRLPTDIEMILLAVYQTTSVATFNAIFSTATSAAAFEKYTTDAPTYRRLVNHTSDAGLTAQQDRLFEICERLHTAAQNAYVNMVGTGEWTVPKSDKAAFTAASSANPHSSESAARPKTFKASVLLSGACFNCGKEGHRLDKCPEPKNPVQIKINSEAYRKAKAKNQSSTPTNSRSSSTPAPWDSLPAPGSGEPTKKNHNGVPIFYNPKRQKWCRDKFAANTAATPSPATATTPTASASGTAPAPAAATPDPAQLAQMFQLYAQFGHLMKNVNNQFSDQP